MFDYRKARAVQQFRYKATSDEVRNRRRRCSVSIGERLDALAGGLASIGVRQGGRTRPSSPAY
jgi:hypothetical protein